jgi:phosphate starvation-inducible PhoH-like protein
MTKKATTPTSRTGTTKTTKSASSRTKRNESTASELEKNKLDLLSLIKIDIKHKNETQKKLTQAIKNNDITICTGPAGTGKTLLSVAEALILLKQNQDKFHEIKLVKSIAQLQEEDMGTLPGDEKDKLKFIMMSFIDAFHKLIGEDLTTKLFDAGYIKMEVFGSIRGRSFSNCILLIDEYQNVTHRNSKTFLTRFSENTKTILLGDTGQIDLKKESESALELLVEDIKETPEEGVAVVEFTIEDVVRHRLTMYFIKLYENRKKKEQLKLNKNKPQLLTENMSLNPIIPTKKEKLSFYQKFLSIFR